MHTAATATTGQARRSLDGGPASEHLERTINCRQLFKLLGIANPTFARMGRLGEGPPRTRLSASGISYRIDKLVEWLDARTEQGGRAA